MAKWRLWGGVIAVTTLWFWINSYWHMGKPTHDARNFESAKRSLGSVKKDKEADDMMVLKPVAPRTTERIYEQRTKPPSTKERTPSTKERKAMSRWKREKPPKPGHVPPPPAAFHAEKKRKANKGPTTTTTYPAIRIDTYDNAFPADNTGPPTAEEEAEFNEAAAALLKGDAAGTVAGDSKVMESLATPESRLQKLVDRARDLHSPYFKNFEKAAKEGGPEGLVKELMDDPFPVRWKHTEYDHSFVKSVSGDLLDKDHWLLNNMDNKLPPLPKQSLCKFETGVSYSDQGTFGKFEGLSDEGCCQKCIDAGFECDVAEMSPVWAHPPRVCTLKVRITSSQEARGFRACWKPGTSPNQFLYWRELGDKDRFD